jgi:hypothetical protein
MRKRVERKGGKERKGASSKREDERGWHWVVARLRPSFVLLLYRQLLW